MLRLLLFCFGFSIHAFTQRNGFIKYDAGVTFDETQFTTNTSNYQFLSSNSGISSLTYVQQISNLVHVELGVQDRYFATGVMGSSPDTHYIFAQANYLNIPLRLILNKCVANKFSVQQRLGVNMSIAHTFSNINKDHTFENYPIVIYKNFPTFYLTINLGLGFCWVFSKSESWMLTLSYDYNISTTPILDVMFHDPIKMEYGHITANGNYHTCLFGVGYRISNLWNKDKLQ
jgi:hypothetical protein